MSDYEQLQRTISGRCTHAPTTIAATSGSISISSEDSALRQCDSLASLGCTAVQELMLQHLHSLISSLLHGKKCSNNDTGACYGASHCLSYSNTRLTSDFRHDSDNIMLAYGIQA